MITSASKGGRKMVQPIFVHARVLFTVLAYHDPSPSMLSELPPVVGMVLQRAERTETTVSRKETRV